MFIHFTIYTVIYMGKITVDIDDDLETKLRNTIFERFGYKKGNLKKALEEAMQDWINKKEV